MAPVAVLGSFWELNHLDVEAVKRATIFTFPWEHLEIPMRITIHGRSKGASQ